jgi:4'-phosphopantetheinyl transferase
MSTPHQGGIALGPGEVQAWLVDLDDRAELRAAELDDAERDRAGSYLRPRDGARFAASRAALRLVLAGYLGRAPVSLRFLVDLRGRPRLADRELQFSLARSAGLALIAVSLGPVGADLERVESRPGLADLAAARFSTGEAECIAAGCGGSPMQGFYRHWTAKEAYLKAVGHGLAGLRQAELACGPRPAIRLGGRPAAGWALSVIDAPAGYAAAIAASQPVTQWWRLAA